jgi:hypothetical protein
MLPAVMLSASIEASAQLPMSADSSGARPGTISGIVGDSVNVGISGATVSLAGAPRVDVSADDGAFDLPGVPAGTRVLIARRIGFRPESVTVTVVPDSVVTVRIRLRSTVQQVAPVVITASRVRHVGRLRGFNERRDRGIGRFFTADEIERRNPRLVSDLLRTLPGTRISPMRGQSVITFRGLRCAPLVWLDGTAASVGYLDVDLFPPSTLAGIEVYSGPSTVPAEFTWVRGKADCGVIALWTKMPEMRGRPTIRMSVNELEALLESSQLFTADLVDTPVAADSAHPLAPVFPDSLMRASIGGRVVAEFVVDINGLPNMGTFSAVLSTNSLFTDAVREAVSAARFTPAWRGGKRVRQLVQLPFTFAPPQTPKDSSPGDLRLAERDMPRPSGALRPLTPSGASIVGRG